MLFTHFEVLNSKAFTDLLDINGNFSFLSDLNELIVKVSAIGYETATITLLEDRQNTIILQPSVFTLGEIPVTYVDRERELLKKVLENVPLNYPQKTERLKGEVVEVLANSLFKDLIYAAKASIEADKFSYSKNDYGNVQIADGQVTLHQSMDSTFIGTLSRGA